MDFEHRKPRAIGPTPHSAPEKKESSLLEQIEFKEHKIENQQKKGFILAKSQFFSLDRRKQKLRMFTDQKKMTDN